MNRTSLCIRMLLLLNARGQMSTKELAEELETNPRNIREFKKELITAGYNIVEQRGRYGGYRLDENNIIPAIQLTDEEKEALLEGRFIVSAAHFDHIKAFDHALDKVISSSKNDYAAKTIYLSAPVSTVSETERKMIETANSAKQNKEKLIVQYQSRKRKSYEEYIFDPYELIHFEDAYYIWGWSYKRNAPRTLRISEQRMKKCEKMTGTYNQTHFIREKDCHIENYIGKNTIFKGKLIRVSVCVQPDQERFFEEKVWGVDKRKEGQNIYSFLIEDKYTFFKQLFSLKGGVKIIAPEEMKQEYVAQLETILRNYKQ